MNTNNAPSSARTLQENRTTYGALEITPRFAYWPIQPNRVLFAKARAERLVSLVSKTRALLVPVFFRREIHGA